jgi:hypothetical protein
MNFNMIINKLKNIIKYIKIKIESWIESFKSRLWKKINKIPNIPINKEININNFKTQYTKYGLYININIEDFLQYYYIIPFNIVENTAIIVQLTIHDKHFNYERIITLSKKATIILNINDYNNFIINTWKDFSIFLNKIQEDSYKDTSIINISFKIIHIIN